MSDKSVLLAAGEEFEYEGRKYRLRPFTLKDEAIYEAWLERQAYEAVLRNRAFMEPDEYRMALGDIAIRSAAGDFDFISPVAQKSLISGAGIRKVLKLTLEYSEPSPDDAPITEKFVAEFFNARMAETLDSIKRVNSDPKVPAEPAAP